METDSGERVFRMLNNEITPQYEVPPGHCFGNAPKPVKWIQLVVCFIAFLICSICTLLMCWLIVNDLLDGTFPTFALTLPIGAFLLRLFWGNLCRALAHIRFESNGIWVKWPLRKAQLIQWSSFQQVCICPGYEFRKDTTSIGLCFVRHGERKNMFYRWKVMGSHYQTVIYIEYTPELHAGLKERCPMKIDDLRNTW